MHCDIRAENVLITHNKTTKLTNFKLSHKLSAAVLKLKNFNKFTLNQGKNLERARYYAPELLEGTPNFRYDYKCEVYSFGILLWEIAEEKTPYKDYEDIMKIVDLVSEKYRESFSVDSQMPVKFRNLALKGM